MPFIHFEPDNLTFKAQKKTTILKASKGVGIMHPRACGGRGRCSTCRVKIVEGLSHCHPRNSREKKIADFLGFKEDIRLACQTVVDGDVRVKRLVLDEIDIEIANARKMSKKVHKAGELINATLVFMDLYNFTAFTEKNQAYDVVHLLNRYYFLAGKAIDKYDGAILDYYGDGILAIFGHKNGNGHAQKALNACLAILGQMDKLNNYVNLITPYTFRLRIGIHTGNVVMGTLGMPGFEKLAVVGDDVNIASRIEYANKEFNSTLLISETTKKMLNDAYNLKEHHVLVKGKNSTMKVYEVDLQYLL